LAHIPEQVSIIINDEGVEKGDSPKLLGVFKRNPNVIVSESAKKKKFKDEMAKVETET